MCGIAGIIQSTLRYNLETIERMTRSLAHRGPDGERFWQNTSGQALLGHRRLAIIDLSEAAAQPMHFRDRYSIVHNGEIYNYIELKKELQNEGYSFHTHSDTEVILAAYDHWEDECVEHFDGMFAFAIWDEEEQELFAARDRFGEKPFYYRLDSNAFIFASEIKAFRAAGFPRQLNRKMLFNFITIGYVDNPAHPEETFFEDILKLPPASRLYYSPQTNELEIEQYWEIDPAEQDTRISDNEASEKFLHLLNASVKRRLRADVSVGTSLSGGLDSSAITALGSELGRSGQAHQCFTAVFPGFEKDELPYSSAVSARFGLEQFTVPVTLDDMLADWERFMEQQDEPVSSSSAYAQYKVFDLAKQHGVTILLDGQGADETLAGYHKYYKWYWQELFQRRRLLRSGEITAARSKGATETFGIRNIVASLFPELASVVLERQYLFHALSQPDLSREFVQLQSKEAYYTTPPLRSLNGLLHFNSFIHGLEELLRYADRNSMAHGREVRLPFLGHELVEFVFSLPAQFKIRKGWTKWILRTVMDKKLPSEISWRQDKIGFEPPQKKWMTDPRLQQMILDARRKLVRENILKPEAATRPVQPANAYEPDAFDWRYLSAAFFL